MSNRIITVSREFGSGGRELGKRLAEALNIPCYDHEIISIIAKENGFDEQYVANVSERSIEAAYPLTIGQRFAVPSYDYMEQPIRIMAAQRKIIENFARQGDCVIVGRSADSILEEEFHPLNLFVYADMNSKVLRCTQRAKEGESLKRSDMEKQIRRIDKERIRYHEMYSDGRWGDKENYHLCVNTSGHEIKELIPGIAEFARCWFKARDEQAD